MCSSEQLFTKKKGFVDKERGGFVDLLIFTSVCVCPCVQ